MIPLIASVGVKLLPFISKLGGLLGPVISKFAPMVTNLLSKVTTAFPQLAGLAGKVSAFAAKNREKILAEWQKRYDAKSEPKK